MARISVARDVHKPQEFASDGSDAVGFIHFWGNSPALDLLHDPQAAAAGPLAIGTSPSGIYSNKDYDSKKENDDGQEQGDEEDEQEVIQYEVRDADEQPPPEPVAAPLPTGEDQPVNILIVGGADIRHVLKTLAKRRSSEMPRRKLRFFLHETRHEVLARHVLFLQILNNTSLPVRERMELFLSVYGNSLVRERDNTYVEEIAKELVEFAADDSAHPLTDIVDLSHLKYKDRDLLQDAYKGWLKGVPFDAESLREQRCRGYYRNRWDFRKNMMDWDYQTHIKQRAGIINWFHYKEFCFSGVAFESRLASYNTPNRTLASYTEATDRAKGTTVQVRGFWCDIINSPYHAFSTQTNPQDWPRLFKISGSQYRHTETDVAEFNVAGYIHEMETGQPYHLPPEQPEEHEFPYASPLDAMKSSEKVEDVTGRSEDSAGTPEHRGRKAQRKTKEDWPPLSEGFEGVEVVLLAGPLQEAMKKSRYSGMFHRAFFGAMALVPLFEEMQLTGGGDAQYFQRNGNSKIRKPPRVEAPAAFGKLREESFIANMMAPGAEIVFETLKYQAHFEGLARLGFRHRIAQAGHLAGWQLADEKRAVPRLEADMKERRANELEKDATDFMRFVTADS